MPAFYINDNVTVIFGTRKGRRQQYYDTPVIQSIAIIIESICPIGIHNKISSHNSLIKHIQFSFPGAFFLLFIMCEGSYE